MRLLNLGCGGQIAPEPFINLDELRSFLPVGTPERTNLDALPNYVDFRLLSKQMPFEADSFGGIACIHVLEHFNLHDSITLLKDCYRILEPGASIMISVPDASYFRQVHTEDTESNAIRLFGEPIYKNEAPNFLHYGLLTRNHLQAFTADSLWAVMRGAGFDHDKIGKFSPMDTICKPGMLEMARLLNRHQFSLVMIGDKS